MPLMRADFDVIKMCFIGTKLSQKARVFVHDNLYLAGLIFTDQARRGVGVPIE
jgi:hypothetical protein